MDRCGSPWRWTPGGGRVALDVELGIEGVELDVELDVDRRGSPWSWTSSWTWIAVELAAGRLASGHWRPWSSASPSCGVSRPTRRGGGAPPPSPPLSALLSLRHHDDTLPS